MRKFKTTLSAINSKSTSPKVGDLIETEGFSTIGDGGGAKWIFKGLTSQTPSQTPAQLGGALLNDASGNQWAIKGGIVNIMQLGRSLIASLSSNLIVDITGAVSVPITSQLNITSDINIICNDESVITGYDGAGILFSGSNIKLDGVNISGFYDGTDQNKENFSTAFICIETGTQVDSITVEGGSALNCRSVIRGTGNSSDTQVDTTIKINKITITKNKINGCPLAYYFRCAYTDAKVTKNTCINAIGASKGLTPYSFYVDGQGFNNPIYSQVGEAIFSNNIVHTVVNRTTTGDSSPGNSYECHAFKASGEKILVNDNIITDCTGVNSDCESIYTKARYTQIKNNVLIDAGTNEGAINVKGTSEDSDSTNTSPFGEYSIVSGNIIAFTKSQYNNGGTVVDLDVVGMHIAVPERCIVSKNIIIGSNQNDIVIDGVLGSNTENNDIIVSENISYGTSGASSIKYRGAFNNSKCFGNICDKVKTDGNNFYMIDLLSVSGRGYTNKSNEFYSNQLKLGYDTANEAGFKHSFIRIDLENYDYNTLKITNNMVDINPTSASARPIYVYSQSSSFTGVLNDLIVKHNTFLNNDYSTGPVFFNRAPKSFDIDIDFDWVSTENSAKNAMQVTTLDNTQMDAELKVFSSRVDADGFAQRDRSELISYTSSGSINIINNTAETPVGNSTGIGVTLATTDDYLRVRISGEDSETWRHKINLKAVSR